MMRLTFWETNLLRNLEVSGGWEVKFACLRQLLHMLLLILQKRVR